HPAKGACSSDNQAMFRIQRAQPLVHRTVPAAEPVEGVAHRRHVEMLAHPREALRVVFELDVQGTHGRFTLKRRTAASSTSMPSPGLWGTGMKPSRSMRKGLRMISRSIGFSQTLYSTKSARGSTALKCRLAAVNRSVSQACGQTSTPAHSASQAILRACV